MRGPSFRRTTLCAATMGALGIATLMAGPARSDESPDKTAPAARPAKDADTPKDADAPKDAKPKQAEVQAADAIAESDLVPQTKPASPATKPAKVAGEPATTEPATKPATKPTAAATAPAVDPAVAAKVKGLLGKLSDPDWKVRKEAADELERLGEPAEPALVEALKQQDLSGDARTAIEVLLKHAGERRRIGATLVTLELKDAEPLAAISAIAKQADLKLSGDAVKLLQSIEKRIDVRLDREPFWSALIRVGADAGAGFTGLSENEINLAPLKGDQGIAGPANGEGPFALTIQRVEVTIRKVVDFAGVRGAANPMANAFVSPPVRITIAAWAEPRIKPGVWMLEGVSDAKTDKGKSLTAQIYSYTRNTKVNDGSSTFVTLSGDTEGATKLVSMTVQARYVLQWNTETFEIDNPAQAGETTKNVAGNRVVFKNMRKSGDNWSYEVVVYRDTRTPEEWQVLQQTIDRNGCKVVDADGKALQQRGSGSSWSSNEIRVNGTVGQVNGAGDPKKLTWELPGKLETMPAEFEFKNVPLP